MPLFAGPEPPALPPRRCAGLADDDVLFPFPFDSLERRVSPTPLASIDVRVGPMTMGTGPRVSAVSANARGEGGVFVILSVLDATDFAGDAPGGVIGGGANAISGRCGRSELSAAKRRAALTLNRRDAGGAAFVPTANESPSPRDSFAWDDSAAVSSSAAGFHSLALPVPKSCSALSPTARSGALAFRLGRSRIRPSGPTSSGVARQSQESTPTTFPDATSRTKGTRLRPS